NCQEQQHRKTGYVKRFNHAGDLLKRLEIIAQEQHDQGYQRIEDILLQDAVLQFADTGKALREANQGRDIDQLQHGLRDMAVETGSTGKYPGDVRFVDL